MEIKAQEINFSAFLQNFGTPNDQDTARKTLTVTGLMEEKQSGIPRRLHHRLYPAAITNQGLAIINSFSGGNDESHE